MGFTTKLSPVADAVPFTSGCRSARLVCAVLLAAASLVASAGIAPANEPVGAAEPADDPVIAAAGDIAGAWDEDEATAALLDAIDPTLVFALGDLAYYDGTDAEFNAFYDPTWGRHKDKTRPIVGNHEYHTRGRRDTSTTSARQPETARRASTPSTSVTGASTRSTPIAARSTARPDPSRSSGCAATSRPTRAGCTLAMGHSPRFSSHAEAGRRDNVNVAPLYEAFYAAAGDVWLAGHNHFYERLSRLDPSGAADPERGSATSSSARVAQGCTSSGCRVPALRYVSPGRTG